MKARRVESGIREHRRGALSWLSLDRLDMEGARHGFTLRYGGASRGKFSSLNFTSRQGDRRERVEENWRRIEKAAGLPRRWALVSQVHGAEVTVCRRGAPPCHHRQSHPAADAIVALSSGMVSGVLTADCLPVLFASAGAEAVGAAHAGWQGTLSGVVVRTVESLSKEGGIPPRVLVAGLGPSIGKCCGQVGDEFYRAFREKWGASYVRRVFTRADPWRLDLQEANRIQLLEAGLREENIASLSLCTVCRPDLFYSHRRDGLRTGRMLNFVCRP